MVIFVSGVDEDFFFFCVFFFSVYFVLSWQPKTSLEQRPLSGRSPDTIIITAAVEELR